MHIIDCLNSAYTAFETYLVGNDPNGFTSPNREYAQYGWGAMLTIGDIASLTWDCTQVALNFPSRWKIAPVDLASAGFLGIGIAASVSIISYFAVKVFDNFLQSKSQALEEIQRSSDPVTFSNVRLAFERPTNERIHQVLLISRIVALVAGIFFSPWRLLNLVSIACNIFSLFKISQLNWLAVNKTLVGRKINYSLLLRGNETNVQICAQHMCPLRDFTQAIVEKLNQFGAIVIHSSHHFEKGIGKVIDYGAVIERARLPDCPECHQLPQRFDLELWRGSKEVDLQFQRT